MDIRLDGRSAMVTGGSKGLGFAIASAFAAAGADVAMLARGREALEMAQGKLAATAKGRIIGIACDVAQAADLRSAQLVEADLAVAVLNREAGGGGTDIGRPGAAVTA